MVTASRRPYATCVTVFLTVSAAPGNEDTVNLTPFPQWEPSSESSSQSKATPPQKPKAIPLPAQGGLIIFGTWCSSQVLCAFGLSVPGNAGNRPDDAASNVDEVVEQKPSLPNICLGASHFAFRSAAIAALTAALGDLIGGECIIAKYRRLPSGSS